MPKTHTRRSVLRAASATAAAIGLPRSANALVPSSREPRAFRRSQSGVDC